MPVSILYPEGVDPSSSLPLDEGPAADLGLTQVFDALEQGREQLDLESLLRTPLASTDQVAYRHQVMADLERRDIADAVRAFGASMAAAREVLGTSARLRSYWQRSRVFIDAVSAYCRCVDVLAAALERSRPASRGLTGFGAYLGAYRRSEMFTQLSAGAEEVVAGLAAVRYGLHIKGTRVTVSAFQGEPDYAQEVATVFDKFREGAVDDYRASFLAPLEMEDVEAEVLNLVARLHPEPFGALDRYFQAHQDFVDATVAAFEREAHFYLSYLDYIQPLRAAGLPFCYPSLSDEPGETRLVDVFDLALARKASGDAGASGVVTNDLALSQDERRVVVTGPNSGGKTTFARAVGQLHHLASLGLPVPASEARLVLVDKIFTSFQQAEPPDLARSHLEDELVHLREVIERAGQRSLVVLNESLSSTTLRDAAVLGRAVLDRLLARGPLCIYVTFVDELASTGPATVSLVATVSPDNPVVRTYKLERRPAEGLAYAAALAERYGLTYHAVSSRLN
jgi:hypothetical protein